MLRSTHIRLLMSDGGDGTDGLRNTITMLSFRAARDVRRWNVNSVNHYTIHLISYVIPSIVLLAETFLYGWWFSLHSFFKINIKSLFIHSMFRSGHSQYIRYELTLGICKLWKLVRRWHISFRGLQSIMLRLPLKFDNVCYW